MTSLTKDELWSIIRALYIPIKDRAIFDQTSHQSIKISVNGISEEECPILVGLELTDILDDTEVTSIVKDLSTDSEEVLADKESDDQ